MTNEALLLPPGDASSRLAADLLSSPMARHLPAGERSALSEGRVPVRLFDGWMDLRRAPAGGVATWFSDPMSAPCPFFDPAFYLEQNPDVRAAGIPPLVHFLQHGLAEGRRPSVEYDTASAQATVNSKDWVVYGAPLHPVGRQSASLSVAPAWLFPMTEADHAELACAALGAPVSTDARGVVWAGPDGIACGNWIDGDAVARLREKRSLRPEVSEVTTTKIAGPQGSVLSPATPRGWVELALALGDTAARPTTTANDGPALIAATTGSSDRDTLWAARRVLVPLAHADTGGAEHSDAAHMLTQIDAALATQLASEIPHQDAPPDGALWIVMDCMNPRAMRSGHLEHAMLLLRSAQLGGRQARLVLTHETDRQSRHFLIATQDELRAIYAQTRRQLAGANFPEHLAELSVLTEQINLVVLPGLDDTAAANLAALKDAAKEAPPAAIMVYGDIYRPRVWQCALGHIAPVVFLPAARENPAIGSHDLALTQELPVGQQQGCRMGYRPPVLYDHGRGEAPAPRATDHAIQAITAVGNGCLEEWLAAQADAVQAILSNADLHWHLVGIRKADALLAGQPQLRDAVARGQLTLSAFDPNILATVANCDLYLHPPGLRGGGSVVGYATARGVAVIAGQNDAASLLPDPSIATVADWVQEVQRMTSDAARADLTKRQTEHLIAASQPSVVATQINAIISAAHDCRGRN